RERGAGGPSPSQERQLFNRAPSGPGASGGGGGGGPRGLSGRGGGGHGVGGAGERRGAAPRRLVRAGGFVPPARGVKNDHLLLIDFMPPESGGNLVRAFTERLLVLARRKHRGICGIPVQLQLDLSATS